MDEWCDCCHIRTFHYALVAPSRLLLRQLKKRRSTEELRETSDALVWFLVTDKPETTFLNQMVDAGLLSLFEELSNNDGLLLEERLVTSVDGSDDA